MMCLRWRCRACDTEWEDDSTPDACIRCDSGLPPTVARTDLDHDAEITDLRAKLAAREEELRNVHAAYCHSQEVAQTLDKQIAAREAEVARLGQRIIEQCDKIQRLIGYTLADHKTPRDRAQRINDLAADYAGQIAAGKIAALHTGAYAGQLSKQEPFANYIENALVEAHREARRLAEIVVEAEE